jgi:hypothetical protein
MKRRVIVIVALLGLLCFGLSFVISQRQWGDFLIGLAGNLIALAVGSWLVNQFLESDGRRRAIRALLILSEESINDFHQHWLALRGSGFNPADEPSRSQESDNADAAAALSDADRKRLYALYKDNSEFREQVKSLDETLIELSRLAGWSLDPEVMEACLKARTAISRLGTVVLDDSASALADVSKQLLAIDVQTEKARRKLKRIADGDKKAMQAGPMAG